MLMIGLIASIAGFSTYAWFSSQEIAGDNVFATGTLDLGLTPASGFITASNLEPGGSVNADLKVTNDGTLDLKYKCTASRQEGHVGLYDALTAEVTRTTTIRYQASWSPDIPKFRVDISITADGTYVTVSAKAVDSLPEAIHTLSLDKSLNIYIDENHNGEIDASDIFVSVINEYYLGPGGAPSGWQDEGYWGPRQPISGLGIVITKKESGDIGVKIPYSVIDVADRDIIGMRFQAFGYAVLPLPAWEAWLDVTLCHYSGSLNALGVRVGEIMTNADGGYRQWDTLAFKVGLSSGAGNELQDKSTTVKFTFDATQVENPGW